MKAFTLALNTCVILSGFLMWTNHSFAGEEFPIEDLPLQQSVLETDTRLYSVSINNTCRRSIKVAIRYRDSARGWITRGWWNVSGNTELETDITSEHNQFYMHGTTLRGRQWPPEKTRKRYNRYNVLQENDFIYEDGMSFIDKTGISTVPFSLKEISTNSLGLKARFDC